MRRTSPRIEPVRPESWSDDQREVLQPLAEARQAFNIFTTLGQKPRALKAFLVWGRYVLNKSSLPARERELVILRVGYLCKSGYEWAQHVRLGKQAGLTDVEITRIKTGPSASGWRGDDAVLLRAADELCADHYISDATWGALAARWSQEQCMDLVFVAANYVQVCMILNTFGIQLDKGLEADPDLSK